MRLTAIVAITAGVCGLAACGTGGDKTDQPPTLAKTVPGSFDPCRDMPADALETLKLTPQSYPLTLPSDSDRPAEKRKGCEYYSAATDAGNLDILWAQITNQTVDYYRYFHKDGGRTMEIGGKPALAVPDSTGCIVMVDIPGGSLRFDGASHRPDTCQLLEDLATKVVSSPKLSS